ncbi:hypothetical protein AB4851_29050 [Burkholderia sp. 22PA0099]
MSLHRPEPTHPAIDPDPPPDEGDPGPTDPPTPRPPEGDPPSREPPERVGGRRAGCRRDGGRPGADPRQTKGSGSCVANLLAGRHPQRACRE